MTTWRVILTHSSLYYDLVVNTNIIRYFSFSKNSNSFNFCLKPSSFQPVSSNFSHFLLFVIVCPKVWQEAQSQNVSKRFSKFSNRISYLHKYSTIYLYHNSFQESSAVTITWNSEIVVVFADRRTVQCCWQWIETTSTKSSCSKFNKQTLINNTFLKEENKRKDLTFHTSRTIRITAVQIATAWPGASITHIQSRSVRIRKIGSSESEISWRT